MSPVPLRRAHQSEYDDGSSESESVSARGQRSHSRLLLFVFLHQCRGRCRRVLVLRSGENNESDGVEGKPFGLILGINFRRNLCHVIVIRRIVLRLFERPDAVTLCILRQLIEWRLKLEYQYA